MVQTKAQIDPLAAEIISHIVGDRIVPARQDIFFFAPTLGDARLVGANLPIWVDASSRYGIMVSPTSSGP
ncbi:MAG: hypothetical protein EOR26_17510 [Mesorhizobium sp.]|uniref:hypothetical protein n=1 Tax=Mesorhizobium sp. TaxID=1871066 RepID=UPI000FE36F09|nr:hypothetical protein [Mesorhizobium sp.]RWG86174.1 MAG: hypothetical protein EOQ70_16220 [Mesorhizobium sp.]RWI43944.1 MAG: hypothetical protein EOR15_29385 [Mesorhizobium sp.]RWJ27821.1 MAG: hypothetical protein EOR26_17510 [Mesorhizobium sp.]RWJ92632.1 MAG: hypothetical protein EOR37_09920 [Mesorhizobium sp.]RWK17579.1 MAG: hypothetical protein EOR41_15780 [Mesorhizobium sp.]